MSNNLRIYEQVRSVPASALKKIEAGRLKGKSDINPMWRLKALTEQFGPCGIGWKYEITEKRLEQGANDEISSFVDINLYVRIEEKWSEAIPGTGGSSFVTKERNGHHTSDECFKMALTDAISVACKALGFGADVYWNKDATKYSKGDNPQPKAAPQPTLKETMFYNLKQIGVTDKEKIVEYIKSRIGKEISSSDELTEAELKKVAEDAKKMKESV